MEKEGYFLYEAGNLVGNDQGDLKLVLNLLFFFSYLFSHDIICYIEWSGMMKLLVEYSSKEHINYDTDGIILALEDYSVESIISFSLKEISDIRKKFYGEIFVKINKNLMNDDIEPISEILKKLDSIGITGIFFYDLAILQLKKELNLSIDLVWNQTHMVHNYRTCDYYYEHGVKYALLGKEITLDEIIEIIDKSKITSMVEVISKPSVGFSKRRLLTNYYHAIDEEYQDKLTVSEKVTDSKYTFLEDNNGTSIFLDTITNGTGIIHDLYQNGCSYIIFREYGIDSFLELVSDTRKYILDGCCDDNYIEKYKKLGNSTNFFFKKTIYKVKKNG